MARDNAVSRRTALKLTGAAASTALVAGCGGSGNGNGNGGNGNGNGNGNGDGGSDAHSIEPGTTIELRSLAQSWEGIAPSQIEGVENPNLSLTEGETYTITWAENEQGTHNLAVYDDSESAVAGPTDQVSDEEPGLSVEFEASSDTVEYVCEPHYTVGMAGSIELE